MNWYGTCTKSSSRHDSIAKTQQTKRRPKLKERKYDESEFRAGNSNYGSAKKHPQQIEVQFQEEEKLGFTVPLHCLEAWKAACVNSWIHRHGAACGKEIVSELSCWNHACRTTAEQRQLSLLASCRFQDKPIGNYLPQTPQKTDFGSKLEAKI